MNDEEFYLFLKNQLLLDLSEEPQENINFKWFNLDIPIYEYKQRTYLSSMINGGENINLNRIKENFIQVMNLIYPKHLIGIYKVFFSPTIYSPINFEPFKRLYFQIIPIKTGLYLPKPKKFKFAT